jgi:hypothetical protein
MMEDAMGDEIDPEKSPIEYGAALVVYVLTAPVWVPFWCIGKIAGFIKRESKMSKWFYFSASILLGMLCMAIYGYLRLFGVIR